MLPGTHDAFAPLTADSAPSVERALTLDTLRRDTLRTENSEDNGAASCLCVCVCVCVCTGEAERMKDTEGWRSLKLIHSRKREVMSRCVSRGDRLSV